jgi:hypothetical protein
MHEGLEGSLLRIVPSGEARPPNMLTTDHSSDPSRIFSLPIIAFVPVVMLFCADFAAAVNLAVHSVYSSPLL